MIPKHFHSPISILILLFLGISVVKLPAGTTGKISGNVIDARTKEPLIGVNIQILGTTLGASTDDDGVYFILNIPPGVYQVEATYVGYASRIFKNVKVSVDQTTKISFELQEKAIEGETVEVVAEQPIIKKDLTSTESRVSGKQIELLPIEDVATVVNLQAGVVEGHFRGGRSNEVKYLIDGVSVNDVFSGASALQPETNSVEEVQVLVGTFNAEYGEALSGVVNQVTKIAGNKLTARFSGYSGDYVSSHSNLFQHIEDVSPTSNYNFQGSLSGPIPGTNRSLKFFLAGRYFYDDGYIYGRRVFNPSDSSNFSANNPADWFIGNTGDSSFVPMNFDRRFSLQGKLSIKVGNSSKGITLNALYQNKKFRTYNGEDHLFKLNPDGDYKHFQDSFLGSASYTHIFSASTFLDLLGSVFTTKTQQYVFKNPLDPRYVNPDRKKDVSGNAFLTGGTQNWQFRHTTTTTTGKIDLTSQVTPIHLLKGGLEFDYHTLNYRDFQIHVDATSGFKPALPKPGSFDFNTYKNHPYQFAAYLQDKIELEYLIVNLGIRFDYFEPDGQVLKDPNKIAELDTLQPPFPGAFVRKASSKSQVSPRFGISYPISSRGAIHISYGHFFQVPPFEFLYKNPNFRVPLTGNFPEFIGDIIGNADLKPQRTVMYEIGLQQQLSSDLGVTLTGYYKDIRNLLGTEIHTKNEFRKFAKYINRDYGTVQGISVSFEKRLRNGFGGSINYTYQVAKGNASDPNDAFNKTQGQGGKVVELNKQLVPLDWDRRHALNFTLTIGKPGDFVGSFIGQLGSGLPYTPSFFNQRTGLENSDNRPMFFNVDFFLTKQFRKNFSIFAKVFNLFDRANEKQVFTDTGRATTTLELTRAQQQPRGVNTLKEFFTRPDFFSAPRQIVFGLTYGF